MFFRGITRKVFHRPTHRRLWFGKVFLGGHLSLGFQCPISIGPAMEKVQPCPQQGQNTGQYPESLVQIKAQSSVAQPSVVDPSTCQTHVTCLQARECTNKEGKCGSPSKTGTQRESVCVCVCVCVCVSLLPWDYISLGLGRTRCFF